MQYGLRKSLDEVKVMLVGQVRLHGATHFVFIAPFDLKACGNMNAFASNIREGKPVPDHLLSGRTDLDIYFVERKHKHSFFNGDPMFFSRMSISNGPEA